MVEGGAATALVGRALPVRIHLHRFLTGSDSKGRLVGGDEGEEGRRPASGRIGRVF